METKFTRGVLYVREEEVEQIENNLFSAKVRVDINGRSELHCKVFGETKEEALANAKLIAAGSELLLGLEMAAMVIPKGNTRNQILETIKKATE